MKEYIRAVVVYFLTLEAKAILTKYKPRIIVVTGSVGKTSTKDAVYAALKNHTFVRKSEKNFNSDIGVPLTVLGVPNGWGSFVQWARNLSDGLLRMLVFTPYPRWLVVEVGADRPGDISRALRWVKPDIAVATRFPDVPVHVEFYASPEEVIAEELFLVKQLRPGAVAVLNNDDEHARSVPLAEGVRRLTYGFSKDADVRAGQYRVLPVHGMPNGISFSISYQGEKIHLSLYGVVGRTHVYAVLAGIAGALAAGAPFAHMSEFADSYEPPPARLRLIPGAGESVIIDDSYNASPEAMQEALRALEGAPTPGKRIALLADMLELGAYSADAHRKVGEYAAELGIDMVVTVGVRARKIAEQAREKGMHPDAVHSLEHPDEAASFIRALLKPGDVILVKGSQSMRMEKVVKALMQKPEDAPHLLARQDREWLSRAPAPAPVKISP